MKQNKYSWIIGFAATLLIIAAPVIVFSPKSSGPSDDPWAGVPVRAPHTDHSALLQGPYESGPEVTQACLECHQDAGFEVMQTVHWTWEGEPVQLEGRDEPVTIGKKNQLNNFCIGIQSNWPACTSCHAGYGWEDQDFDFANQENIDCLVCHDQSGTYVKSKAGLPAEGVDLVGAAQSVGVPSRENCGSCHFNGGGGDAVKHGDLDQSLYYPPDDIDVHMGKLDFLCIDCHQTEDHVVSGRSISVSVENSNQIYCTDCHTEYLHDDQRLNDHVDTVACQTCHIPQGAVREATKMEWDWSTAGQDYPEDPHVYLKIKGSFVYEEDFVPEYTWYNGFANRYILGDEMDPTQTTVLNPPSGDRRDPDAKIWPFKVHRAKQPYDTVYNILLQPKTVGEGGFWTEFDWDQALRLGSEVAGIEYSGEYGFAETEMYWPTTHMVAPAGQALQCTACHGEDGRLDWQALGYPGDPVEWGGRPSPTP